MCSFRLAVRAFFCASPDAPTVLPSDASYGSDRSGLISGFLFRPGASGETMDTQAAAAWLRGSGPAPDGGFAWLHFNLANAVTERWLRDHLGEAEAFFDALHEGSRSTRSNTPTKR